MRTVECAQGRCRRITGKQPCVDLLRRAFLLLVVAPMARAAGGRAWTVLLVFFAALLAL
jgi:hypothetical protein